MGIKKIKSEKSFLSMTIADMLAKADPSKTKKYTQFLARQIEKTLNSYISEESSSLVQLSTIDSQIPSDTIENEMSKLILTELFFSTSLMDEFISFCELMDRGLTNEKDISKYDSWEMLRNEYFMAKNKDLFKKSKKDIFTIYEDTRYLILKPLSYLSSISYGYQTKWCTAMINDNAYFYNHSNGVLIYVIDKMDNKKVAFYKNIPGPFGDSDYNDGTLFSVWNSEDKRIDSYQSGLPFEIIKIISSEMDPSVGEVLPNYTYFSESEKQTMRDLGHLHSEESKLRSISDLTGLRFEVNGLFPDPTPQPEETFLERAVRELDELRPEPIIQPRDIIVRQRVTNLRNTGPFFTHESGSIDELP